MEKAEPKSIMVNVYGQAGLLHYFKRQRLASKSKSRVLLRTGKLRRSGSILMQFNLGFELPEKARR